nr:hypothetical protein [Dyella sp. ASV24]
MQQFIPFEDEWDILDRLSPEDLIPYHVGVPCRHDLAANEHQADLGATTSPTRAPTHGDVAVQAR